MTTPTEPQGDYGYDLVHEDVRAARAPEQRSELVQDPWRDPRRTAGSGDYSYDEAHGA